MDDAVDRYAHTYAKLLSRLCLSGSTWEAARSVVRVAHGLHRALLPIVVHTLAQRLHEQNSWSVALDLIVVFRARAAAARMDRLAGPSGGRTDIGRSEHLLCAQYEACTDWRETLQLLERHRGARRTTRASTKATSSEPTSLR